MSTRKRQEARLTALKAQYDILAMLAPHNLRIVPFYKSTPYLDDIQKRDADRAYDQLLWQLHNRYEKLYHKLYPTT